MSFDAPAQKCPSCLNAIDALSPTETGSPAPRPGDYTICIYCATLLLLDDGLKLRALTEDERQKAILEHPELPEIVEATREYIRHRHMIN